MLPCIYNTINQRLVTGKPLIISGKYFQPTIFVLLNEDNLLLIIPNILLKPPGHEDTPGS